MMTSWRLLDYVTENLSNPRLQWYLDQDDDVQATFDATVSTLVRTNDWLKPKRKHFEELRHAHAGLSEIRLFVDGLYPLHKFRVVGLYRPEQREFIFLGGCDKQHGRYIPPDAFDVALEYKIAFESGKGSLDEHS